MKAGDLNNILIAPGGWIAEKNGRLMFIFPDSLSKTGISYRYRDSKRINYMSGPAAKYFWKLAKMRFCD